MEDTTGSKLDRILQEADGMGNKDLAGLTERMMTLLYMRQFTLRGDIDPAEPANCWYLYAATDGPLRLGSALLNEEGAIAKFRAANAKVCDEHGSSKRLKTEHPNPKDLVKQISHSAFTHYCHGNAEWYDSRQDRSSPYRKADEVFLLDVHGSEHTADIWVPACPDNPTRPMFHFLRSGQSSGSLDEETKQVYKHQLRVMRQQTQEKLQALEQLDALF